MRLMKLSEYREKRFPEGSRPSQITLRRWCQNGELPYVRRGNLYYIDLDAEEKITGNSLVDQVLSG